MDSQKVFILLLLYMSGISAIEGTFEDADKANDFPSQSNQYYDLRHTIPGEPDIDYPIYNEVPTTSFTCANRHEGYYADMESRCQAFRICTHTAGNLAGFGFLCPNGTLFSQRHFVCDWYRNVRCEESENFYIKNANNHIGSNYEMMEKVKQMIEYPMRTISKALSQKPKNNKINAPNLYTTKPQTTLNQRTTTSSKQKPTTYGLRKNTEFDTSSSQQNTRTTPIVLRGEDIKSLPLIKNTQDVYVNSLGELSTDPESEFDPKTARILAKPGKSSRTLNFAESINYGLNDYFPSPNSLQKAVRSNRDEGTLGANSNSLRQKSDLNRKKSVVQKSAQNLNYQSHGFAKSKNDIKNSYHYQHPKQTAKFSSNDTHNETSTHVHIPQNTDMSEDIHFTFMTTTPTPTPSLSLPPQNTPVTVNSFLVNLLFDLGDDTIGEQIESTTVEDVEEIIFKQSSDNKLIDNEEVEEEITTVIPSSTTSSKTTITTPFTTRSTNQPTTTEEIITTLAPIPIAKLESYPTVNEVINNLDLETITEAPEIESNYREMVENNIASHFAEELPFSGVQTIANQIDEHDATTSEATSTSIPTTITTTTQPEITVMQTSTEMVTEVNMIETHVRSNRREHVARNRATSTTTTTIPTTTATRSNIRRPQLRRNLTKYNETTTTTTTSERPTITIEKHQRHSHRQRQRTLSTTTKTTTAPENLNKLYVLSENDMNRKLSVRNIDQSSSARVNSLKTDSKKSSVKIRYNSINNQRRRTTTTTTSKAPETQTAARNRQTIRSRGSYNYHRRTQAAVRANRLSTATTTTTTTTTTPLPITTTTTTIESTIIEPKIETSTTNLDIEQIVGKNINIIPLNVSVINAIDSAKFTQNASPTSSSLSDSYSSSTFNTISNTILQTLSTSTNNLNNKTADEPLLPFNELTRAIVDESILQNYRSNHQQQQQQQHFKQHSTFSTVPTFTTNQNYATKSTVPQTSFTQAPSILIARAEGERIDTTNNKPFDFSQIAQKQQQQKTSYESLNEFFSKKFGTQPTAVKPVTTTATSTNYFTTNPKNAFSTQLHNYQPIYPQQQQQQQQNAYFTQQQPKSQYHYQSNLQQPQTKHIVYAQPAQSTQQYPQNNFNNLQQHLQLQQPFFGNQLPLASTQTVNTFPINAYRQQTQQQQQQQHSANQYLNIKLPTLNDGLIPVAAQRRSDNFNFELETSTLPRMKLFSGVSSYDVPLSSVGRLPNDITQRLRKIKK